MQSPLSQLDEVDVYERTRLEEEGITSVQALARHDLVDLILSSRIPVPRLIDWVDQAILLQHVPASALHRRCAGSESARPPTTCRYSTDETAPSIIERRAREGGRPER